jgi:hypothetical protein
MVVLQSWDRGERRNGRGYGGSVLLAQGFGVVLDGGGAYFCNHCLKVAGLLCRCVLIGLNTGEGSAGIRGIVAPADTRPHLLARLVGGVLQVLAVGVFMLGLLVQHGQGIGC